MESFALIRAEILLSSSFHGHQLKCICAIENKLNWITFKCAEHVFVKKINLKIN